MPHQCTNCGHTFPDGSKEMLSGCPDCGGNKFQFKPSGWSSDTETDSESTDTQPKVDKQSTADKQPTANKQPTSNTQPTADKRPTANKQPTADKQSTAGSTNSDSRTTDAPSTKGQRSPPEMEGVDGDVEVVTDDDDIEPSAESPAQSTARSDVVSPSELTAAGSLGPESTANETATDDEAPPTDEASARDETAVADTSADSASESMADMENADTSESNLDELRKELNNQFESIRITSPGQYELNLMELYDRDEYIISLREDGRYVIEVPDGWGDS